MTAVLSNAGRSFLRAFAASLILFLPGFVSAPNLDQSYALGVSALVASIAAGLRALQDFVPQLQVPGRWGDYIGSFLRAFIAQGLVLTLGILNAPDLNVGKAAIVAVLTGALTAGFVAIQKKADVVAPTSPSAPG